MSKQAFLWGFTATAAVTVASMVAYLNWGEKSIPGHPTRGALWFIGLSGFGLEPRLYEDFLVILGRESHGGMKRVQEAWKYITNWRTYSTAICAVACDISWQWAQAKNHSEYQAPLVVGFCAVGVICTFLMGRKVQLDYRKGQVFQNADGEELGFLTLGIKKICRGLSACARFICGPCSRKSSGSALSENLKERLVSGGGANAPRRSDTTPAHTGRRGAEGQIFAETRGLPKPRILAADTPNGQMQAWPRLTPKQMQQMMDTYKPQQQKANDHPKETPAPATRKPGAMPWRNSAAVQPPKPKSQLVREQTQRLQEL